MDKDFEAVIFGACRTPIGAFGGAFKDLSAVDLGTVPIREAVARAGVAPADVGGVVMGCVLQAGNGMNVARQAALEAGLPIEVPGETVNRVCGSGLPAVAHAVDAIRVGYVDTIVAGGTESMSNAPYLVKGARWVYRMGNAEAIDSMMHEGLTCAMGACHMGITAEEVATAETLAALKPAFRKDGTVTTGNASGINDGTAALASRAARRRWTSDAGRSRASSHMSPRAWIRRSWASIPRR
jgi:acetyl-CoA acetyltransferase